MWGRGGWLGTYISLLVQLPGQEILCLRFNIFMFWLEWYWIFSSSFFFFFFFCPRSSKTMNLCSKCFAGKCRKRVFYLFSFFFFWLFLRLSKSFGPPLCLCMGFCFLYLCVRAVSPPQGASCICLGLLKQSSLSEMKSHLYLAPDWLSLVYSCWHRV